MSGQLLTAGMGLAFVLGLIFLFTYLMKKYGGHLLTGTMSGKKKPEIELLDVRALDPKNRLVLSRCRETDYLLLVGESNLVVASYPVLADNSGVSQEEIDETL